MLKNRMKIINLILAIVTVSTFIRCSNSINVTRNRIELPFKIDHAFGIFMLNVKSNDSNGFPETYDTSIAIYCLPVSFPSEKQYNDIVPDSLKQRKNMLWKNLQNLLLSNEADSKRVDSAESLLLSINKYITDTYFKFIPQNTIYFDIENEYYRWCIDFCNKQNRFNSSFLSFNDTCFSESINIFPYKIEESKWYKISLSNESCYFDDFYFMFDKNDCLISDRRKGNCGDAW